MRIGINALLFVATTLVLTAPVAAAPLSPESQRQFDQTVKPFLATHCFKCHNDQKTRAGFRIDTLGTDFLADKTADSWKEIYDNLGVGKMPPKEEVRPKPSDVAAVMDWIDQEIRSAERLAKNSSGRTRRLNRTEYFNTLRDLLHLNENYVRTLEDELPPDGKVDGFDRVGASLYIDQSQLSKYFELAERVLTRDVFAPRVKVALPVKDLAKDIRWSRESEEGNFTTLRALGQFAEVFSGPNQVHRELARLPTGASIYELKNGGIEYLAGGKGSPIGSHGGYWTSGAGGGAWTNNVGNFFMRITQEGKYRLKLRAGAFAGKGKYAVENVKLQFEFGKGVESANLDRGSVVIDAPLDQPRDFVMDVYLRPRSEIAGSNRGTLTWNGVAASEQMTVRGVTLQTGLVLWAPDLWKLENELISEHYRFASEEKKKGTAKNTINELLKSRYAEVNEKHSKFIEEFIGANKPVFYYNPDFDLAAVPRLWLESWEVEGPIVEWPSKARTELLFDGDERTLDAAYVRESFARFLPRAYRRAVSPAEIDDWVAWVGKAKQQHELSDMDAFKLGLKSILCSPGFLFIQEPTGDVNQPQQLADFELASRLSYFLWSTMPDEELFKLAAEGRLHEPQVLAAQVRRMIADPKGIGLVTNFTGQWLQVRDFGKTMTDRNEFKSYTDELRKSSWQEPYEFFKEILHHDLSILNFLDSDFVVIDKRLANHYGIEGVKEADGFTRVAIQPEQHRGGVLGMAGVLAYLSDGFRTLPVRRAAYVVDTLWNDPAKPPPPNAGDLPAVKGTKLTVRQRLEQHRNTPSCASCHNHLDPFGVALENYDAIGRWRERQTGEGFRGDDKSPPLDVSGVLPSGQVFSNVREYRQALLTEKDRFVRGFTQKMLTYALGRSIGATDRASAHFGGFWQSSAFALLCFLGYTILCIFHLPEHGELMMKPTVPTDLEVVSQHFSSLEDPRSEINLQHPLASVVVIGLMAVLAGADGPTAIAKWALLKQDLLLGCLDLPSGIPRKDVFRRVLSALNPLAFQTCFAAWLQSLRDAAAEALGIDQPVLAIDGKTLRRSHNRKTGLGALHSVSVWASEFGLSLGQVACAQKSNEITAIPEVLRLVDIRGAIITIDAMGTQTAIAAQIIDGGGDYLLSLKGNQETTYQGVIEYIDRQVESDFVNVATRSYVTTERGHGREEVRTYIHMPAPKDLPGFSRWKGLKSIGVVLLICMRDGKQTTESRYYLSSMAVGVKRFARAARGHWGIENTCHWCLDVTYREDESRMRNENLRENFAWLRRFTLSLLKQVAGKESIAMMRRCCGWDDNFLLKILSGERT